MLEVDWPKIGKQCGVDGCEKEGAYLDSYEDHDEGGDIPGLFCRDHVGVPKAKREGAIVVMASRSQVEWDELKADRDQLYAACQTAFLYLTGVRNEGGVLRELRQALGIE